MVALSSFALNNKYHPPNINLKEYNRIIASLDVTFIEARHMQVLQSLTIKKFHNVENFIVLLNSGKIIYTQGDQQHTVAAGDILFVPGRIPITITYGQDDPVTLNNGYCAPNRWKYFQAMPTPTFTAQLDSFSYVTFEAHIFNTVNFFASLDIPPFVIKKNERLSTTLKNILTESNANTVGSGSMVKAYTAQLIIEIVRHIIAEGLFVEKVAAHSRYFKNPRLLSIFRYIQKNLHNDLSNRILATVAQVSEDYAGQYFKMHTGINPQDYIEYQRMEHAVKLLRTTQTSIRDIGKAVGFKDTAYFCRRFKMKFGVPAGKVRRQKTIMRS